MSQTNPSRTSSLTIPSDHSSQATLSNLGDVPFTPALQVHCSSVKTSTISPTRISLQERSMAPSSIPLEKFPKSPSAGQESQERRTHLPLCNGSDYLLGHCTNSWHPTSGLPTAQHDLPDPSANPADTNPNG